jgi:probable HAF family extracellular repeat protein
MEGGYAVRIKLWFMTWAICLAVGSLIGGAEASTYHFQDLGNLGLPDEICSAQAINDVGQIVGTSSSFDAGGSPQITLHAFIWNPVSGMVELGTLGGANSWAYEINNSGQVVGYAENAAGRSRAFLWTSGGGLQDLGTLGGNESRAYSINNSGKVVGVAQNAAGYWRAFSWTAGGGMEDLGTLGGNESEAKGVNDAGAVVGSARNSSGEQHACLWVPGEPILDLGIPTGGYYSYSTAINSYGDIIGVADFTPGLGMGHAFFRDHVTGVMQDLTTTAYESSPHGINDANHVVGYSMSTWVFIWSPATGGVQNLQAQVVDLPAGYSLNSANGINNKGQIVGGSQSLSGLNRNGFLLTPVALPPFLLLLD